ncbi:hypothetical protein BGW80DRAFT_1362429, partial [Lactifluus volemus]
HPRDPIHFSCHILSGDPRSRVKPVEHSESGETHRPEQLQQHNRGDSLRTFTLSSPVPLQPTFAEEVQARAVRQNEKEQ